MFLRKVSLMDRTTNLLRSVSTDGPADGHILLEKYRKASKKATSRMKHISLIDIESKRGDPTDKKVRKMRDPRYYI